VIGVPAMLSPVGTVIATLVTVPVLLVLLLKVFQSVLVKYPLTKLVAAAIEIAGVVPPDDTTGAVPVTEVIVPTLIDPPKLVLVPLIVMAELASCALEIVPDRSVVGIVAEAVITDVPLPLT
jgi:hypothetical protein